MKNIRLLHRYLGLFFSPAILFFAFSGGLQTLNLHENNKTTGYAPPRWVVEMAQIHKKQTTQLPRERTRPAKAGQDSDDTGSQKGVSQPRSSSLPLKCFLVAMSIGLMATTLLGMYMAFGYGGRRQILWSMLIGGALLPMVMMLV